MALRQHKPNGNWYAYYRGEGGKWIERSTGTSDKRQANDIAAALMDNAKIARRNARLHKLLNPDQELVSVSPSSPSTPLSPSSKSVKLKDLLPLVEKYRDVSISMRHAWQRFIDYLPPTITHANMVTPELAFAYLQTKYGDQQGKTWNNNKTYLHNIFKSVLLDAKMQESPFARVIQRKDCGQSQRPFTDEEATRIITAAKEPWKSAALLAWYTGMRQKDCFALRWDDIQDNIITIKPAKTARYNRSVQIPIHPELVEYLSKLPRKNEYVLGFVKPQSHVGRFTRYFGDLLDQLKITDNENGIVVFNSFRNSFVTRCDAGGIARHALRGIVGHKDDKMTNLYSHDITGAKQILTLPGLQLNKKLPFTPNSKKCM